MTDLLEDLTEEELKGLLDSARTLMAHYQERIRMYRGRYGESTSHTPCVPPSDADVLRGLLAGGVGYLFMEDLATTCRVRKVLLNLVRGNPRLIGFVQARYLDHGLCLEAARGDASVVMWFPEPIRASIRKELGI